MELLQKNKIALRISTDAFDDEIKMLIGAAKLDLEESGINVDLNDELINASIVFFVKAHFGYDNLDSGKQLRAYEACKRKLALGSRWIGS